MNGIDGLVQHCGISIADALENYSFSLVMQDGQNLAYDNNDWYQYMCHSKSD